LLPAFATQQSFHAEERQGTLKTTNKRLASFDGAQHPKTTEGNNILLAFLDYPDREQLAPFRGSMSIIPPVVLTATQLVGSLVASAKNARDLAKDSSNSDLKAAISDLYDDLLSVKERVLDLDEENRKLRAQLEQKDEVVGPFNPHGYFYKKTDDAKEKPLCPRCFQTQPSKVVFLSPPLDGSFGWRKCVVCGFDKFEPDPNFISEPRSQNY
jgi:hypothetical protein